MKKTLSMLLSLIVILTAMAVCSVSASASTSIDPKTLTPEGDYVFFIRDPDANGYLPGDGSGFNPDNPLKVIDHEKFDPAADHPKWYLQTELYQATEMLSWTGGTVVITGPVHLGANEAYGNGTSSRDVYTCNANKPIKFTSVYNGVDYRETNGAKITIEAPATLSIDSQSIWENIDIETKGSDRTISFNGYSTLIGEGVNCYPADSSAIGNPTSYISISGGHRYAGCYDTEINLTVQSGTYCSIAAGAWGVNKNSRMTNVTTNLVLEGTTKVLSMISGTSYKAIPFSGNANITINSGTYQCDIWGVGMGGVLSDSGVTFSNIKIIDGDFSSCQNIGGSVLSTSSNILVTRLDCSGWMGDIRGLAQVYYTAGTFTSIKIPAWLTTYDIENAYDPNYKPSNQNGWVCENNFWYYYENGLKVKNDWRKDSIGWCYLGQNGMMLKNTWAQDSKGWCYLDKNGYWDGVYHESNRFEKNGWYKEDGIWYYYESDEKVINAWREDSTGWCFLDEEGKWVIDAFVKDSVGWAYITKDGYFYYDTNGWIKYYEDWYFLEGGYAVTNQWRADSMGWCYLSETGAMVTNGLVADSTGLAYITTDGYFYYTENGWRLIDDQWYFIEGGYAVANQWRQDSTGWCFLGEDGAMLTSTFVKDSTGWCYLNENGYWDGIYHDQIPA